MSTALHSVHIAVRGLVLGALTVCMLMFCGPSVFALDPALDISQYAHTSWKIRDGFTKGAINSIAQTPDGYLWLGTDAGLLRFDGVKSVAWPATSIGQPFPGVTYAVHREGWRSAYSSAAPPLPRVPDSVMEAVRLGETPEGFVREMRLAAAIFWYARGQISQGKGAEIAGLKRREFIEALGRAQVDAIQITEDELKEEVERDLQARRERLAADLPDTRRAP